MSEQWRTHQEILAALARFEAMVPGYAPPDAYAVGLLSATGTTPADVFSFVSDGRRRLPSIVLAIVCGHVAGSATYRLTRDELAAAIHRLAPAEACQDYEHPNLVAWRAVAERARHASDAEIVAVFLQDGTETDDGVADQLLRAAMTKPGLALAAPSRRE